MTLVIAVLCKDGVVLGADGAATSSTTRKEVDKLTFGSGGQFAFSLAGNPTLGQSCFAAADAKWGPAQSHAKTAHEFAAAIRFEIFSKALEPELKIATRAIQASPVMAQQNPWMAVQCNSVLAGVVGDGPVLFMVTTQGQLVVADANLPMFAVGSGGSTADPFLLFLRKLLWPVSGLPDIGIGILTVLWALEHAIATTPGGIGPPVSMATVKKENGIWATSRVDSKNLDEHRQAIQGYESRLTSFVRGTLGADNGTKVRDADPLPPPVPQTDKV